MLKTMDIQEAYLYIQDFAKANQVDELTGIEYMVKYYQQLSVRERLALEVFMNEAKVDNKLN
jgi:hypothetical protein